MDVYSGVRWSAFSKYGAMGMQFVISLVLARLLAPEYFGLLGMATVITGFVRIFKNLGFSSAIVQRKEVSKDLLSTLFWVNLAACVLVGLIVLTISPLSARLYDDSRITPILAALSINFLFAGFTMIPTALLQRRMEFRKLAIREFGGILVAGPTAITLAYLGYGVWALVASTLASSAAQMILINLAVPFCPRFVVDHRGLRECLKFGLNLTAVNIFTYFARQADNFLIGVFLGPVALGYYAMAYKLMLLPRTAVTGVVTRVLFPKLSRLQDQDEELADKYLRTCGAIAFITFPMMTILAVLAEPFVQVLLGEKWLASVPVIQILAPVGMFSSIQSVTSHIYLAKGRTDIMLRWGMISGTAKTISFIVGLPFGISGVAASFAIVTLLLQWPAYTIAFRLVDSLTVNRLAKTLFPHFITAIVLAGTVWAFQFAAVSASFPDSARLLTAATAGVIAAVALAAILRPMAAIDMRRLLVPKRA